MKKKIIVGLDFDGVVAYNPVRLARYPISLIKQRILGVQNVSFFVPQTTLTRTLWALAHETSVFPARGASYLRELTENGTIEAHLVTARFGFLEENLRHFLRRWNLEHVFTTITLNTREEQPHLFKERIINDRQFDHFIEDNWDIVTHLTASRARTDIHWIYNILDRGRVYPRKYPFLYHALKRITASEKHHK